jgi:hypothetical protein
MSVRKAISALINAVDDFVAAGASEFNRAQQGSTGCPHLLET